METPEMEENKAHAMKIKYALSREDVLHVSSYFFYKCSECLYNKINGPNKNAIVILICKLF